MHRIDGAGATVDNKFTEGDPVGGVQATVVTAPWLNDLQEELMSILTAGGVAPVKGTQNQVLSALTTLIRGQGFSAYTTAGASPAFTLTPSPAIAAYSVNQRFSIKFNAAAPTSATLDVSGKGPKNLKQYDSTGAKVATAIGASQITDVVYDGTDFVVLDPLPTITAKQLQSITASVASNALTLTLNSGFLEFRSATLSNGIPNSRSIPTAISLVIPSGATLGSASATLSRLVLLAIDNAGSVELAVVNLAGGINLDETTLVSTTAISGSATAPNVIYSTTARANVPFRVVGFVDSTQAAAGTWATGPSTVQGAGGQSLAALSSIGYGQTWQNLTGSRAAGTTYTNTTGKPIMVAISNSGNPYQQFTLFVNGSATVLSNSGGINYSHTGPIVAIIPSGATYSISITTGTLSYWSELR